MNDRAHEIYVIGAGGHGKVAVRAAEQSGLRVVAVFDDDPGKIGTTLCGVPVLGPIETILEHPSRPSLVAIGDNQRRLQLAHQLNLPWATVVHPRAFIDSTAQLGPGALVLAGAVVQADARVGAHAIVNDNATIEHDCHVGPAAHVSTNACLTGGARVGIGVLVGAGAVLMPNVLVADFATVGAGAVVTKDVAARSTVVGVPARPLDSPGETASDPKRARPNGRIYLSPPHMAGDERQRLLEAFDSNWIAPVGPQLDEFERRFAERLGVRHAVAVSSGTAALHLALLAVGVERGDRVLTSTLTFVATANAIRYVGGQPVFIDSERTNWNLDPNLLEDELRAAAARRQLPKAAIVVDILGQCADWDPIVALCRRYGVALIEDAAEALGASYHGRPAGTLADVGCFSFNGNKIITTGGGGMLVTDHAAWADHARHLATQARDPAPHYEHSIIGFNYRLSNLAAAIGLGQLAKLDDHVERRRQNFASYRRALGAVSGIEFMPEASFGRATRWLTCLLLDPQVHAVSPAEICARLNEHQIEARPMWKPMHRQPLYAGCSVRGGGVAEEIFRRGLCLPSGSNLAADDLEYVAATLLSALEIDQTARAA